jgi:group II intron reverse transcriptase/maturase
VRSLPDDIVEKHFTPERIKSVFLSYENTKRDRITGEVSITTGADGISYKAFKEDIDFRCRNISRRVCNGSYQFYPFREIEIPKSNGGTRTLSIASIKDVLVQKILYEATYEYLENYFARTRTIDIVSFAYRKHKSAPAAAVRIHCYLKKGFFFVLDADIVSFFDRIPHERLSHKIDLFFGKDSLARNLLRKYIKTGGARLEGKGYKKNNWHHKKPSSEDRKRQVGIPQGGVLSGMLANLYLHEFDSWVIEELNGENTLKYVRYADDFVILSKEKSCIESVKVKVSSKLKDIGLEIHKDPKTKILDLHSQSLDFVGFSITPSYIRIKEKNINRFKERLEDKIAYEKNYETGSSAIYRLKFFVENIVNRKILGCGDLICQECGGFIDDKVRSWIGFFSVLTDTDQLNALDKWIRVKIGHYFYNQYGIRLSRSDFRNAGLASLVQEYYRLRKRQKGHRCTCPVVE